MSRVFDQEEFSKNIYVIKHKLGELKPAHQSGGRWDCSVGNFQIVMWAFDACDVSPADADCILRFDKIDIVLNEFNKEGLGKVVSLRDDPRFKNYEPIQYNVIKSPGGKINLSNGDGMPILHVCELIRYLHRLSNLTAFM